MEQTEYHDYYRSAEKKCQTIATELSDAGNLTHSRVFVYSRTIVLWIDFRFRFRARDMALGSLFFFFLFSPIQAHTYAYCCFQRFALELYYVHVHLCTVEIRYSGLYLYMYTRVCKVSHTLYTAPNRTRAHTPINKIVYKLKPLASPDRDSDGLTQFLSCLFCSIV